MTLRPLLALGVLVAGACSDAPQPPPKAQPEKPRVAAAAADAPCAVTGASIDLDPEGLRVRDAPGPAGRELGRLYPAIDPEIFYHDDDPTLAEGLVGAQFTIDRVSGDWLHVTDIDPVTEGEPPIGAPRERRNFQGSGWVHAAMVQVYWADDSAVRERPDRRARPIAAAFPAPDGRQPRIAACRGAWVALDFAGPPPERGWLLSESNAGHARAIGAALAGEGAAR